MIPAIQQMIMKNEQTKNSPITACSGYRSASDKEKDNSESFSSYSSSVFDDNDLSNQRDLQNCKDRYENVKARIENELDCLKRIVGIIGEDPSVDHDTSEERRYKQVEEELCEKRQLSDCYVHQIMAIDDENWLMRNKIELLIRKKTNNRPEKCVCVVF